MAVGRGKRIADGKLVGLDVGVGDRILFAKYSGSETTPDASVYFIMREGDVLGVLHSATKTRETAAQLTFDYKETNYGKPDYL